jgi:hypothetical protein
MLIQVHKKNLPSKLVQKLTNNPKFAVTRQARDNLPPNFE